MKAIIRSIKPKEVYQIAYGEQSILVSKTAPKLHTPFKVYVYCTNNKKEVLCVANGGLAKKGDLYINGNIHYPFTGGTLNGKVIGEFVCDRITELESEFWDDETYESIGEVWYDQDDGEREVSIFADNDFKDNKLCRKSCVSWEELREYIGTGIKTFYGWHISDLKIYDKPKELSEFGIKRPFQSWGYVYDRV